MMVKLQLEKLNINYKSIELGEVELVEPLSALTKESLRTALLLSGLEVMDDPKAILVEKICNIIIEKIHYSNELLEGNFSDYLATKTNQNYPKIAEIFSKTKGITIEHYIILHKVEKIKELIMYEELNITEISYKLNYSSVAHLSRQFKQITGLTPSFFRSLSKRNRSNLEDL
jgi:AraC-like DNA-binding protein